MVCIPRTKNGTPSIHLATRLGSTLFFVEKSSRLNYFLRVVMERKPKLFDAPVYVHREALCGPKRAFNRAKIHRH